MPLYSLAVLLFVCLFVSEHFGDPSGAINGGEVFEYQRHC